MYNTKYYLHYMKQTLNTGTMKYIVINIGCIECGVSSNLVGVYDNKIKADKIAANCGELFKWRQDGQNAFRVYKLGKLNHTKTEYIKAK